MFIRKYEKDGKTYYLLNIVDVNKRDKTNFISCFIPEALANYLIKLGVTLKTKEEAE